MLSNIKRVKFGLVDLNLVVLTNHRVVAFDGIRGVAVILVMLLHAHFQYGKGGAIGVDVFFVLSGFLITKNLLDDYSVNGFISIKNFWIKRFFRLFPPFFILLISVFILSLYIDDSTLKNAIFIEIRDSFLYLSNFSWLWSDYNENRILGHTWSLSVEQQFYIVWPLFLCGTLRFIHKKWFFVMLIIIFICLSIFKQSGYASEIFKSLYFESVFIGCIFSIAVWNNWLKAYRYSFLSFVSFILICAIGLLGFDLVKFITLTDYVFLLVPFSVILILLNALYDNKSLLNYILSFKPLVYIGSISYGLYLWHIPVFRSFKWFFDFPPSISFVLKFVVTFVISSISYFLLEKKMQKISKDIISKIN